MFQRAAPSAFYFFLIKYRSTYLLDAICNPAAVFSSLICVSELRSDTLLARSREIRDFQDQSRRSEIVIERNATATLIFFIGHDEIAISFHFPRGMFEIGLTGLFTSLFKSPTYGNVVIILFRRSASPVSSLCCRLRSDLVRKREASANLQQPCQRATRVLFRALWNPADYKVLFIRSHAAHN